MSSEKIIIDADKRDDPRIEDAKNILYKEQHGLICPGYAYVDVDGHERLAVTLTLSKTLRQNPDVVIEAVRRAGLTVLENAKLK